MRVKPHRTAATLLLAATALCASPYGASAQQRGEPSPNVTVQERPRPDFDPIGIRAGSFFLFPSIGLAGVYDDNVFAEKDEESDFATVVTPLLRLRSNFSRHSLNLDVGAETAFYAKEDDNNYQDVFARGGGQLEITRDNLLNASFDLSRLHEDRDSPDDSGQDEITKYYSQKAGLSYRRNFNRLFAIVGSELLRFDYQDTDDENNDDRDRNQLLGRARLGYEIGPRLAAFVQGTADARRYDETPDDGGFDRDSEGYGARVGATVDITSILFGEVSAGYTYRNYDDEELDSVDGLGLGGSITWNVTPLTSIIFEALGEIQETTVAAGADRAAGNFQKTAGVDLTHELLRNVLLNANAAYIRDDFEGIDRTDDSVLLGGGVSYLLNRNLSLDATYSFRNRFSDESDEEYTRNIIMLGLTAKL